MTRIVKDINLWSFQTQPKTQNIKPNIQPNMKPNVSPILVEKLQKIKQDLDVLKVTQGTLKNILSNTNTEEISDIIENLEDLKNQLQLLKTDINDLTETQTEGIEQFQELKLHMKTEVESLESEIELVKETLAKGKAQRESNLKSFNTFISMVSNISNVLDGKITKLTQKVVRQLDEIRDKNSSQQESIEENTKNIRALLDFVNKKIDGYKREMRSLQDAKNNLENQVQLLQNEMNEMNENNFVPSSHLEDFSKLKRRCRDHQKNLQEYIEETRKTLLGEIFDGKKRIKSLEESTENEKMQELLTSIEAVESKNTALKNKIDEITEKVQIFNWQVTIANNRIEEAKNDMKLIRSDLSSDFSRNIEKVKQKVTGNTSGISDINTNLLQMSELVSKVREDIYKEIQKTKNKKSCCLVQLKGLSGAYARKQKIPLNNEKYEYTFHTNGTLSKIFMETDVKIQVFLNDSLLTVIEASQPYDLNVAITEGDKIHFVSPEETFKGGMYVELYIMF